jgi:hypothetical protein
MSHFLPPILRQISTDDTIHFLAAQSKRAENINVRGSHGEVLHTVPFQPLITGQLQLPALRVQYFDPVAGRVAVAEYRPPLKWSIARYWQLLLGAGLLLAGIFIIKKAWCYGLRLRLRRQYMREAIQGINTATTDRQLRQALHLIARAESWPANLSLGKWKEYWNRRYLPSATPIIEKLSIACYARSGTDTIQNRDKLLKLINSRKPNRRFFQANPG